MEQNLSPGSQVTGTRWRQVLANTMPRTMPIISELSYRALMAGIVAMSDATADIAVMSKTPYSVSFFITVD